MTTVTFKTKTGDIITETFGSQHANGFVPDYNLRALALGWIVVSVEKT